MVPRNFVLGSVFLKCVFLQNSKNTMAQPSTDDIPTPQEFEQQSQHSEPTMKEEEEQPAPKKRKRKPRKFKVSIETDLHKSVTSLERSGPSAAASEAIRGSVTQMALRKPHRVWVKSAHKYHPYTVTRDYDNRKHRRFTLVKAGDSILNKDAQDPAHQIPTALLS